VTSALALACATHFRLRSARFLPLFTLHANRSIAQVRKPEGLLAEAVQREARLVNCTLTAWRDERARRAYGASGAHRKAEPQIADWIDETSLAHWNQSLDDLPTLTEATYRLSQQGRALPLRHPARAEAPLIFDTPSAFLEFRL
jgi:hypothetical protein